MFKNVLFYFLLFYFFIFFHNTKQQLQQKTVPSNIHVHGCSGGISNLTRPGGEGCVAKSSMGLACAGAASPDIALKGTASSPGMFSSPPDGRIPMTNCRDSCLNLGQLHRKNYPQI